MSATIKGVNTLTLIDGPEGRKNILKYSLADNDGKPNEGEFNLDIYVENLNGCFFWGGKGSYSLTAKNIKLESTGGQNEVWKLIADLQRKDKSWNPNQVLDLGENLFNINGTLTYLQGGPAHTVNASNLQLEGDIDGRTFAVASDADHNVCRIAYRTVLNEKISLAEVKYDGKYWSLPKEIDVYEGDNDTPTRAPGQNIALIIDPEDHAKRSLFFCYENGEGVLYQQEFNPKKQSWDRPTALKYKAHRFSKFGSAYYKAENKNLMLLFYATESGDLSELVGNRVNGKWQWSSHNIIPADSEANVALAPRSFLAVSQRGRQTVLLYRNQSGSVSLLKTTGGRDEKNRAKWLDSIEILGKDKLMRNSPLAVVHRREAGQFLTFFYVNREGRESFIYSHDYLQDTKAEVKFSPRIVGKLESDSILGTASFYKDPVHDARLFSVSSFDGDNVLVDRVPKFLYQEMYWVVAGGIVDTDADALTVSARSTGIA